MDEHPVAFATVSRSPYNCDNNLRYGVSPHPAHAPENSISGSSICEPLTVSVRTSSRGRVGIDSKNSQLARSVSSMSNFSTMPSALTFLCSLLKAGHTSTHTPHPVQSSGACLLYTSDAADDLLCVDL